MATSYAKRLRGLIDTATDKDAVRKSIGARLYANASMGNYPNLPTSSKDVQIDAILSEFEGDDEISADVTKMIGGRKHRKTRRRRRGGNDEDPQKTRPETIPATSGPTSEPANLVSLGPDPPSSNRPRVSSTGTLIADQGGRRRRSTQRRTRKSRRYSRRR